MGSQLSPFSFMHLSQSRTSNKRKPSDSLSSTTQVSQKRRFSQPPTLSPSHLRSRNNNNSIPIISTEGEPSDEFALSPNEPHFQDIVDEIGSTFSSDSTESTSPSTIAPSMSTETTEHSMSDHVPITPFIKGTFTRVRCPSMTLEEKFHRLFLGA